MKLIYQVHAAALKLQRRFIDLHVCRSPQATHQERAKYDDRTVMSKRAHRNRPYRMFTVVSVLCALIKNEAEGNNEMKKKQVDRVATLCDRIESKVAARQASNERLHT